MGFVNARLLTHSRHTAATNAPHAPVYCDAMHLIPPTLFHRRAKKAPVPDSLDDQSGQGMVEYALILVLIAIVVIVILSVIGSQVNNVFSNVSSSLGT
jgi:pilus assembly protein Flp/PilA